MAELSETKRRLLEQRLGARPSVDDRTPSAIPPRPEGPVPLSSGQSALLYEHRLRPDQSIYNVVFAYRLRGALDLDRFERAILTAVARHEPLRTSFGPDRQELSVPEAAHVVEVATDETGFEELARQEALRRFDLEHGPLVRATLARLGPDHHGLILAVHHVASDAASLSNLWSDIDQTYRGEPLAELSCSYSDHAVWQEARITEADQEFWLDHLGLDAGPVDLPLPAPATSSRDGYLTVTLGTDQSALTAMGERPTPFFLSVFAALLQRYTDTDDVVVGVTASTRDHPAVRDLVGYFLTILPLRLPVDLSRSPSETARATDRLLASALLHRHVPYATIAAALRQQGADQPDPARVMFVYDEPHQASVQGIDVEARIIHPEVSVTDLTLFVRPKDTGFEVSVEWDGRRYRGADIDHLVAEFVRMAEWAVSHPGSPWSGLPHPSDVQGPSLNRPIEPIPSLIERQVRTNPHGPAVRCGTQRLTYAELGDRAAWIGAGLAERGVGRGDRVGVLLPRSTDLLATILGILQLGAAYVPIDPSYPRTRTDRVLSGAEVRLTVTDEARPRGTDQESVSVDELVGRPGPPLSGPEVGLDDPAYVIFTSGSTGEPRGVLVDHRRLAASTLARLDRYDEPPERYLLVSSLGFDSSVAGLFWTLATGGELVLPTEGEVHDVDALARLVADAEVSHLLMVPSLYRALLDRDPTALSTLRGVIVAGEACPASLVDAHHRHLPDTGLANEYGPTETTVWATSHQCVPGEDPVPIGAPVSGVRVRVVDRWLRPRPRGAAGQLAIGGAGVTDGYLDEPELTEQFFVSDPATGECLYLSGDLARLDDKGRLLFLGRLDHQISLGGNRIEPEEIETNLLASPGVRAALVRVERQLDDDPLEALSGLGREQAAASLTEASLAEEPATELAAQLARHADGSDVIVAYVEADDIDTGVLRHALTQALPSSMVPSVIEVVEHLARTEHGKVDRAALPPPLRRRRASTSGGAPNDLMSHLLAAWEQVLDTPDLGPDSDFFANGGDSLQAVELVTILEEQLGRRVPISGLVLGRTPRELAALIGTPAIDLPAPDRFRHSYVVPLRPYGERPPLVILPPGGGNLIVFDPLVQALDDRYPVMGFDLPGADRDEEFPESVESLCDTYLPQLRAAQPHGPYRFLGWSFGGVVALELAQRLVAEGEEVDLIGMIDTLVPGLQRANRARAYLELARDGDLKGIATKLRQMVKIRLMLKRTAWRGRRAAARGEPLVPTDRNTWLTIRVDEIVERYQPRPYAGRVVFFAAQDTYSWRTTEPWRQLIPDLEIVPLEGTHEGAEGLLSGPRVSRIASEMSDRLA